MHQGMEQQGACSIPLLQAQAERAEAVQPGEERAPGRPESGISVSEEEL